MSISQILDFPWKHIKSATCAALRKKKKQNSTKKTNDGDLHAPPREKQPWKRSAQESTFTRPKSPKLGVRLQQCRERWKYDQEHWYGWLVGLCWQVRVKVVRDTVHDKLCAYVKILRCSQEKEQNRRNGHGWVV